MVSPHTDVGRAQPAKWISALLDLAFPPHCAACGRLGAWFCGDCMGEIGSFDLPVCVQCGKPLDEPGSCAGCEETASYLAGRRAVAPHVPPLSRAIHLFKYQGNRVLAEPFGEILTRYWQQQPLPAHLIVPVPLHPARLRQRGYNQSLLLAKALAARIALPLHADALSRERNTRSQVGLSREDRWANVWGAFRCQSEEFRGADVLLVDDVYTTGATLEACAAALLEAGVNAVWALTLTRAVGRQFS